MTMAVALIFSGSAFCDTMNIDDGGAGPGIISIGIANGSIADYLDGDVAGYSGGPAGTTFACTSGSVKAKPDIAIIFSMRGSIDPDQPNDLNVYQRAHGATQTKVIADSDITVAAGTAGTGWVIRGRTIE